MLGCYLGKDINIGCGTIFSNYDGVKKFHTNVGIIHSLLVLRLLPQLILQIMHLLQLTQLLLKMLNAMIWQLLGKTNEQA